MDDNSTNQDSATETTPDPRSGDAGAQPAAAATTPATPTQPQAPNAGAPPVAAKPPAAAPVSMVPAPPQRPKRGGIAGLMDDLADDLAGTKGAPQVHQGPDGSLLIEHPELSRKGQWLKIAGEALRGAAAGAAQMHGPGGAGRGFEAGVEAGDKMAEQQRQQAQQQSQDVRQANQDKFNAIKLQHDKAMWAFDEAHAKTQGTQDEIEFNQKQMDREIKPPEQGGLGSVDLGVAANAAELADKMSKEHPDFWKQAYAGSQGRIVGYKEYAPDGKVMGQHFFARVPGISQQFVPEGQAYIKIFHSGKTAQDRPTISMEKVTVPLTVGQQTAYNNAADNKLSEWDANQRKVQNDETEQKLKKQQTRTSEAEEEVHRATAAKTLADAKNEQEPDPALVASIRSGKIAPTSLGRLLTGKQGQKLMAAVEADGSVDTSRLAQYPHLYADFTSGKSAQQRQNLDTAFKTLDDLTSLNTYSSRLPAGSARNAWDNKLNSAAQEIANGLTKPGAQATEKEIDAVKKSLNVTFSRQAALDKQTESLIEQYGSMRDKWKAGAPSAAYEASMPDVGAATKAIMYKHDPEQAGRWFGVPYYDRPGGRLIGFSRDGGKTLEPAQP